MPRIVLFRDANGRTPTADWMKLIPMKAMLKCLARIERLREFGHMLRRPEADYLRDGIHELRTQHQGVNYRLFYFFHGSDAVVLTHGIVKQRRDVPAGEIAMALRRRGEYLTDPDRHTNREFQ